MPFLIQIVIALLIVGVVLWAVQALPGIDPTIKQIIRVVVIVFVVIYMLYLLMGAFGGSMALPRAR